jgi:transposase
MQPVAGACQLQLYLKCAKKASSTQAGRQRSVPCHFIRPNAPIHGPRETRNAERRIPPRQLRFPHQASFRRGIRRGDFSGQKQRGEGGEQIVVKLEEAKRGFVLLPRRCVVERSFAWAGRFRRLSRDYERLPTSLAGLHWLAFVTLMLNSILHQSA